MLRYFNKCIGRLDIRKRAQRGGQRENTDECTHIVMSMRWYTIAILYQLAIFISILQCMQYPGKIFIVVAYVSIVCNFLSVLNLLWLKNFLIIFFVRIGWHPGEKPFLPHAIQWILDGFRCNRASFFLVNWAVDVVVGYWVTSTSPKRSLARSLFPFSVYLSIWVHTTFVHYSKCLCVILKWDCSEFSSGICSGRKGLTE